jgi:quercetin dioxygenase-like cupin family protein
MCAFSEVKKEIPALGLFVRRQISGAMILFLSFATFAPSQNNMGVASPANLPGLPTCMTASVLHGDPTKGPSVLLLKFTPGCAVPWHWHTADETLVLVSGTGEAQMKDDQPMAGGFLFLPGKGIHRFTAKSAVYLYDMPNGAFDIHYVDAEGKEIPPEKALGLRKRKVKPSAGPTTTH